mmetsp:Transcript_982/g.2038  ORF Transcript_982/g.2038 Transcript_982/m.2038 type:complete len:201 (-) Transcript_982:291-893(-)
MPGCQGTWERRSRRSPLAVYEELDGGGWAEMSWQHTSLPDRSAAGALALRQAVAHPSQCPLLQWCVTARNSQSAHAPPSAAAKCRGRPLAGTSPPHAAALGALTIHAGCGMRAVPLPEAQSPCWRVLSSRQHLSVELLATPAIAFPPLPPGSLDLPRLMAVVVVEPLAAAPAAASRGVWRTAARSEGQWRAALGWKDSGG